MAAGRPLSSLRRPPVVGAILVGGASRRFGARNKAAVIGPHVLRAMRGARLDPVVAIGGAAGLLPVPTVADRYPDEGPLGAIATATTFARAGWVVAATCDLPLVDADTFTDLIAAIDPDAPDTGVVASVAGEPQISLGCWPAAWSRQLHAAMRTGERRFRHLLTLGPIVHVEVGSEQLLDADDETTLSELWRDRPNMADPMPPGA